MFLYSLGLPCFPLSQSLTGASFLHESSRVRSSGSGSAFSDNFGPTKSPSLSASAAVSEMKK